MHSRTLAKILEVMSEHPEFDSFIHIALGEKLKSRVITMQLTNPIVAAPTRLVHTAVKKSTPPRVTYFTTQIKPTDTCKELYSRIVDTGPINTRYNIDEYTCVTDIRLMFTRYIATNNLKTEEGTIVDTFLQSITPHTMQEMKNQFLRSADKIVIPKRDKKIIIQMVNEIAKPF